MKLSDQKKITKLKKYLCKFQRWATEAIELEEKLVGHPVENNIQLRPAKVTSDIYPGSAGQVLVSNDIGEEETADKLRVISPSGFKKINHRSGARIY